MAETSKEATPARRHRSTRVVRSGRKSAEERAAIAADDILQYLGSIKESADMMMLGIFRLRTECSCGAADQILQDLYEATH